MNKRMREIFAKMEAKQALAKGYLEGENKDAEKASEILKEIEELKKEYEIEKQLFENEKEMNKLTDSEEKEVKDKIENQKEDGKPDTTKDFAKAVRNIVNKTLNEGAGESGAYTVPEDIVTEVQKLAESKESLKDLITIKKVKTLSGEETYKTRAQATGFGAIEEGGKIPKAGTPRFSRMPWKVTKYGGYTAATNELIEDSDSNIKNIMTEWLSDEDRATWNKLILAIIAEKTPVDLKNLDGIRRVLNITLGSLFKATSKIITNDDGVEYLDSLKDENGRPLLNPDPTAPANLRLRAGANVVPVKSYGSETIETKIVEEEGVKYAYIPFIIGDLKEGIKGFDRQQLELLASKVAVVGSGEEQINAFEEDYTLIRGIERLDIELRDEKAFVNGYIKVEVVEESQSV